MKITMAHGSGGKATTELIHSLFKENFGNEVLDRMEDSAVLELPANRIAYTTDSFVVNPLVFAGGDIGKLSVCGTVNDLLMMGAKPIYLTSAFIIEEGMELELLQKLVESMRAAAEEAGVKIVAGDTKVVEGNGGMFINTSGIGILESGRNISAANAKPGDAVILSGSLGNHHACILSSRMGIKNNIKSDCAPLNAIVSNLLNAGIDVRTMRDVTRGGLATVLNEIAESSGVAINLMEDRLPVDADVRSFCDILGLDPLYMGNEGKLVCIVPAEQAEKALAAVRDSSRGEKAEIIGTVEAGERNKVTLTTRLGGKRVIDVLYGEGLPRIC